MRVAPASRAVDHGHHLVRERADLVGVLTQEPVEPRDRIIGHGATLTLIASRARGRYIPVVPGEWFEWEWDETLYAGSATYYSQGRLPYAPGLAEAFRISLRSTGAAGSSTSGADRAR